MELKLSPGRVLVTLLSIIAFLVVASSAGVAWFLFYPPQVMPLLVNLFNLNAEGNIPTFFSSFLLLTASALLAVIGRCNRGRGGVFMPWQILAVIFLFLAVDETASLHEQLTFLLRARLHTSGYLYFAWVIPYGMATLVVAALFSRFLLRLPAGTRVRFLLAGTIYVTGAVGMEMLGGKYIGTPGARESIYSVLYTMEETLEMLGIAFFVHALLEYMGNQFGTIRLTVARS